MPPQATLISSGRPATDAKEGSWPDYSRGVTSPTVHGVADMRHQRNVTPIIGPLNERS